MIEEQIARRARRQLVALDEESPVRQRVRRVDQRGDGRYSTRRSRSGTTPPTTKRPKSCHSRDLVAARTRRAPVAEHRLPLPSGPPKRRYLAAGGGIKQIAAARRSFAPPPSSDRSAPKPRHLARHLARHLGCCMTRLPSPGHSAARVPRSMPCRGRATPPRHKRRAFRLSVMSARSWSARPRRQERFARWHRAAAALVERRHEPPHPARSALAATSNAPAPAIFTDDRRQSWPRRYDPASA